MTYKNEVKIAVVALALVALAACQQQRSGDDLAGNPSGYQFDRRVGQSGYTQRYYLQLERLARPAINEGLVISNDYLNAYNAVSPDLDLTSTSVRTLDKYVSQNLVLAEAGVVLQKVYDYASAAKLPAVLPATTVKGFIPDVMRINTALAIPIDRWAYNADVGVVDGTAPILTGGRKIVDDTIDITLTYLFAGGLAVAGDPSSLGGNVVCGPTQPLSGTGACKCSAANPCAVGDGVTYNGNVIVNGVSTNGGGTSCATAGTGSNPANPGHHCLYGQTTRNGSANFPFLAQPN